MTDRLIFILSLSCLNCLTYYGQVRILFANPLKVLLVQLINIVANKIIKTLLNNGIIAILLKQIQLRQEGSFKHQKHSLILMHFLFLAIANVESFLRFYHFSKRLSIFITHLRIQESVLLLELIEVIVELYIL
jgi:hypothetical protein